MRKFNYFYNRFVILAVILLIFGSSVYGQPSGAPAISGLNAYVPNVSGILVAGGNAITANTCIPVDGCGPFWLDISGANFNQDLIRSVEWVNNTTGLTTNVASNIVFITGELIRVNIFQTLFAEEADITVRVVQTNGEASFPFRVNAAISAPRTLPEATVGGSYSAPLFTGGTPPFNLMLTNGATPPGLPGYTDNTVQNDSLYSGIPSAAGPYSFSLRICDLWGLYLNNEIDKAYTILVHPAPVLTEVNPNVRTAGTAFSISAKGSNFVEGDTVYWDDTPLVTTFSSSTQLQANVLAVHTTPACTTSQCGKATARAREPWCSQ